MSDFNERLNNVNKLLIAIGNSGRCFFKHNNEISHFQNVNDFPLFIDSFTKKPCAMIYNKYYLSNITENERKKVESKYKWFNKTFVIKHKKSFEKCTNGSTLRNLLEHLTDYIVNDIPLNFCASINWGYPDTDIEKINKLAELLNIKCKHKKDIDLNEIEDMEIQNFLGTYRIVGYINGNIVNISGNDTSKGYIEDCFEKFQEQKNNYLKM